MRILIITGGSLDLQWASRMLSSERFDRIIAADAGLYHCHKTGIVPTDIIGDFDSMRDADLLEKYEQTAEAPVRHFPERKDNTDTDLALNLAVSYAPEEVVIIGGFGSRIDHSLANIGLMIPAKQKGIRVVMSDSRNVAEVMTGPEKRRFPKAFPGQREYLSLIALTPKAEGITLEGFSYPLEDADLHAFTSLGISNEILGDEGTVSLEKGILLVIRAID